MRMADEHDHEHDHDHEHEEEHKCGKCGATFDTEDQFKTHAKEEHGMEM